MAQTQPMDRSGQFYAVNSVLAAATPDCSQDRKFFSKGQPGIKVKQDRALRQRLMLNASATSSLPLPSSRPTGFASAIRCAALP